MASPLFEKLQEDLHAAMREGDSQARDTLRMILSEAKNRRIELGATAELTDADVEAVLRRGVKTRTESAEQFEAAERRDLAERERAEARILEQYLPQTLPEEELRAAVKAAIASTGASSKKELGAVMKVVMAAHPGRVDGKLAQRLAAEQLS